MAGVASGEAGHILHNLLLFGHLLRRLGLNVHQGRMVDAVHVLQDIGMTRRVDVRSALRTLLVHRKDDLPLFDEAFDVFWRQRKDRMSSLDLRSMGEQRRYRRVEAGPPPPGQSANDSNLQVQDPDEQYDRIDLTRTFSTREVLREKDFADFTPEETLQARQLMASLQWSPGLRLTRRKERGRGPALDVRRTLRDSAQYGGELVHLRTRRRKEKPRRLVVICDVSGSMERYTRMLLHFIHSLYAGLENQVEAFLFATRLTHITKQLGQRDIDQAVSEVSKAVPDWSGRDAHRGGAQGVQLQMGAQDAGLGVYSAHRVRRLGQGRAGGAQRRDGAPAKKLPSPHMAEPASRSRGLRAVDPGYARRRPVRRRSAASAQPGGAA